MPIGYVLEGPFLFHKSLGISQEVDQESGIGKTDKKEQILKGRPPRFSPLILNHSAKGWVDRPYREFL